MQQIQDDQFAYSTDYKFYLNKMFSRVTYQKKKKCFQ